MGSDRQFREGRSVGAREAEEPSRPSFADGLRGAFARMAGDARERAAFVAAPAQFLQRHGVDTRSVEGAAAMQALLELSHGARDADPSGAAHAHDGVVIAQSPIHGEGVFASQHIPAGSDVCEVLAGAEVTHTAGKVNASPQGNVDMGGGVIRTTRDVRPGEEIVMDYVLTDGPKPAKRDS